ncbi:long-chain fatty acid--CoA ligase [Nocardia colli]|uniref:Acyl-CoA synthetase n=1 Tax=Nocardia colli TaxID=2545717 RepID=A0A5N0E263_9NOCA|nr:long-chain fatty acid--CoA ligase [Nocardia colli]KAA8883073.1 long-chain fatty acid--CoA ligase [Nocardia colli]
MPTFASASSTLCAAFQATVARNPDKIAVRTVGNRTTLTYREWDEQVRSLAAGFAALGVGPGDRVALLMTNRPEFYPIDVALQHLGAIPFSVYNTCSPEQLNYLLTDSAATVVVCETQYAATVFASRDGARVEHVVCIDGAPEGTRTLDAVKARGLADFDFDSAWRAVRPDDTLTLIYTSGTTGSPKGVQLTHANMLAMVDGTERLVGATPDERMVSFLPSAHVADRWSGLYNLEVLGNQLTTVADRAEFAATLADARPTVFGAVPQVWQKLKGGIEAKVAEATGVKAALAKWALTVGRTASDARLDGRPVPAFLALQERLADALVLSKLRAAVGLADVRLALSGAAPIASDVLRFFNGVGIAASDAWGMSELSGMATMSPPGRVRLGTVGKIVPGNEIRIAEDGEVLVRGPIVMKGYLNKPEQTAEAIDADGWVHSGDIGALDADGFLTIVDRKKELIINAGGKNMSPSNIENWIKAFAPLIGQAVAIGDNRKYNVALIALDPDAAAAYADKAGVAADAAVLAKDPGIQQIVADAVAQANSKLSRVEQIKKFTIVPDFWQPGSEVLTPTMKLRRKPINARYAADIDDLYS